MFISAGTFTASSQELLFKLHQGLPYMSWQTVHRKKCLWGKTNNITWSVQTTCWMVVRTSTSPLKHTLSIDVFASGFAETNTSWHDWSVEIQTYTHICMRDQGARQKSDQIKTKLTADRLSIFTSPHLMKWTKRRDNDCSSAVRSVTLTFAMCDGKDEKVFLLCHFLEFEHTHTHRKKKSEGVIFKSRHLISIMIILFVSSVIKAAGNVIVTKCFCCCSSVINTISDTSWCHLYFLIPFTSHAPSSAWC